MRSGQKGPLAQRRILALRFMLGLDTAQIARVIDQKPDTVRRAQSRALEFLRERLAAVGRTSSKSTKNEVSRHDQAEALTYVKQARVLRARRFQLLASPGWFSFQLWCGRCLLECGRR